MNLVDQPRSVRMQMLDRLLLTPKQADYAVPEFAILHHSKIPDQIDDLGQWTASMQDELLYTARQIDTDRIFVRTQPIDEFYYPGLSFAGVYQSYAPRRSKARIENLLDGTAKVLRGRYTDYSNYYYTRHNIQRNRTVDIMFSGMIDDLACFGTGYVHNHQCLLEYYDTPIAIYLNDPVRIAADRSTIPGGFNGRLVQTLQEIADVLECSVDIEFIIDRREGIHICQVRPIPEPHRRNWDDIAAETWLRVIGTAVASNVVNAVGSVSGRIVDLRDRLPCLADFSDLHDCIYIIKHLNGGGGTASFDFLQFIAAHRISGIRLIVDHGISRSNGHLQYIMYEDPGIVFLANTTNVPTGMDSQRLSVASDGFDVTYCS